MDTSLSSRKSSLMATSKWISNGITSLQLQRRIFASLALMGYCLLLSPKKTAWEQFSSNIAAAVICLATYRKFNFSRMIFDQWVGVLEADLTKTKQTYSSAYTKLYIKDAEKQSLKLLESIELQTKWDEEEKKKAMDEAYFMKELWALIKSYCALDAEKASKEAKVSEKESLQKRLMKEKVLLKRKKEESSQRIPTAKRTKTIS
ncbi:hypothetical protein Tco_1491874 [Tanacetum coccineum]